MVNLLVDMQLAEAYVNTQGSANYKTRVDVGKQVLELHGVSEEELDTTLAWYGRNIDEYANLYEKVDKEIVKRRQKFTEIPGLSALSKDNLWIYPTHLLLSPLSGYDNLNFSIPSPDIEKGDMLNISFHMPNPAAINGIMGVEYTDGSGEAIISNTGSKQKIELQLQTDTSRKVTRIYGSFEVKDSGKLPLYIDSVMLKSEPYDSISYRQKRRMQKTYGPL